MKKLFRSQRNRMVAGVLGGFGEYFNVDPTILRLAFAFVGIVTGILPAVILYVLAAIIIPEEEKN